MLYYIKYRLRSHSSRKYLLYTLVCSQHFAWHLGIKFLHSSFLLLLGLVLVSALELSLVAESMATLVVHGLLLLWTTGSRCLGFSSCDTGAH